MGLTDGHGIIPAAYINPAAFWSLLLALINQRWFHNQITTI